MKTVVPVLFAVLLLAGCVTQKIDWPARVGNYTYDQAVMEFGPPDRTARLSDGSTVAEWLTQRGQVMVSPDPFWGPPGWYYYWPPMYSETYVPARFLRLAFDAHGKLKTWRKFAR